MRPDGRKKAVTIVVTLIIAVALIIAAKHFGLFDRPGEPQNTKPEDGLTTALDVTPDSGNTAKFDFSSVPEYSGKAYVALNSNVPFFTDAEYTDKPFESYSDLDSLGRCGTAYANVCRELMPTERRGDIYMIKPTGWQHVEYDFVDGLSLYNRCHLIAHSLAGEDANEKNLITGTRYMNTEGMNPFENMVVDYVKETDHHVLYRVTPVFEGQNLVASGVLMEGWSVEDDGEGICFCVYCYNVQPGVEIDYSNGKSRLAESDNSYSFSSDDVEGTFILNTKTKKFHLPSCENVSEIGRAYKEEYKGRRGDLIDEGYVPCKGCNP